MSVVNHEWTEILFIRPTMSCDRSIASSIGEFSAERELMLSLSSNLSFPRGHTLATYFFFSSSCHFPLPFLQQRVLESRSYTTWPSQLAFFLFIVSRIFQ